MIKFPNISSDKPSKIAGDRGIIIIVIILSIISILSAMTTVHAWWEHTLYLIIAIIMMFFFRSIDYEKYLSGLSGVGVFAGFILLIITRLHGFSARSITIGSLQIQTLYLCGFLLVFYISRFLAGKIKKNEEVSKKDTLKLFLITLFFCGGIFTSKQSTAIVLMAICIILMYLGEVKKKYLVIFLSSAILLGGILISTGAFRGTTFQNRVSIWATGKLPDGYDFKKFKDYEKQMTYSRAAIARANWFPAKVGQGIIKKGLPAKQNDYVYSVIVEEFGLIVGIGVLFLYLFFLYRACRIAQRVKGTFAQLLSIGIGLWVTSLALIHIGVNCSLFPATGETLPLISSGGVGLIITGVVIGILLNISRKAEL